MHDYQEFPKPGKKKKAREDKRMKEHLKKVRHLPCKFLAFEKSRGGCLGDIVPHHFQGKGAISKGKGTSVKPSDKDSMPSCVKHHNQFHAGEFLKGETSSVKQDKWQLEMIEETNREVLGGWSPL